MLKIIHLTTPRPYIFMPPLGRLEHFLDLLAGIEQTAAALQMPVLIKGYDPLPDWRLHVSCAASRRAQSRYLLGQRQRSRGPAVRPVLAVWPYPRPDGDAASRKQPPIPPDPGLAATGTMTLIAASAASAASIYP